MNEKKIEPTEAMVGAVEFTRALMTLDVRGILRVALNHPDAVDLLAAEWKANAEAAAERAERAEEKLAEAVRVDEVARRVEAAHGRGWDGAAEFLGKIGFRHLIPDLRSANPYRPAHALPTEDGAVIVPSEGRYFIHADGGRYFARLTYSSQLRLWYGIEASGGPAWAAVWYGEPEKVTPGTWKVGSR